jgi:hypothetical protein
MPQPRLRRQRIARIVLVRILVLLRLKQICDIRLVKHPHQLHECQTQRQTVHRKPGAVPSSPPPAPQQNARKAVVAKNHNHGHKRNESSQHEPRKQRIRSHAHTLLNRCKDPKANGCGAKED